MRPARLLMPMIFAVAPLAASACAPQSPGARAARLGAALQSGYGVQYWGQAYTAQGLARAPHGLLIIEAAKVGAPDAADGRELMFSRDEMRTIQLAGRRPVLVYLNLTLVEPWRDYWPADGTQPPWLGPLTQGGDRLAAFWRPEWRRLLRDRAARLMATGADGIFLDDALGYFVAGSLTSDGAGKPRDVPAAARIMMDVVQEVAAAARAVRCDALVVVNNAVFVGRVAGIQSRAAFDSYRQSIDGIMIEDGLKADEVPNLHAALQQDYLAQGLPVLSLDFATGAKADAVTQQARAKGYTPYVVPEGSFASLSPPAVPDP